MPWWSWGYNSYGKPSIAGPFDDEAQGRECKDDIPQIVDVVELPTRSMQRAKSMLRFQQAKNDHDLDSGSMRIHG